MSLNDLFSNPYYWTNNKRRMHGLNPIRNNKARIKKLLHDPIFFKAIEQEIEKQFIEEMNKIFNNFTNIKDIKAGDVNYEE